MIQNINFMAKPQVKNVPTVTEEAAKKFFPRATPHSTPVIEDAGKTIPPDAVKAYLEANSCLVGSPAVKNVNEQAVKSYLDSHFPTNL